MAHFRNPRARMTGALAVVAAIFGAVTVFAAGSVLLGGGSDLAGATVSFVLWTNLILGFAYVGAAALLIHQSVWAGRLALVIVAVTLLAALGFAAEAMRGTPVEPRTAGALALRVAFWLLVAWAAPRGSSR